MHVSQVKYCPKKICFQTLTFKQTYDVQTFLLNVGTIGLGKSYPPPPSSLVIIFKITMNAHAILILKRTKLFHIAEKYARPFIAYTYTNLCTYR